MSSPSGKQGNQEAKKNRSSRFGHPIERRLVDRALLIVVGHILFLIPLVAWLGPTASGPGFAPAYFSPAGPV